MGPLLGSLSPLTVARPALPVASLVTPAAWYDFTQNTFTDTAGTTPAAVGQTVARWDDKRANGCSLSQVNAGNRPTLAANGMNFTGGGRLTLNATDRELTKNVSYYAAIFVLAPASGGTDQRFISHSVSGSTSQSRLTFGRNGNTLRLIARALDADATGTLSATWVPTFGTFYVITAICDYANRTALIRVNGAPLISNPTFFTNTSTSNAASAAGHLGAEPIGSGSIFVGTMKEVQQYNTPLTLSQISEAESALASKYAIT